MNAPVRRLLILVVVACCVGCITAPRSRRPVSRDSTSLQRQVERLAAAGKHEQVLDLVDERRADLPRGDERARLDVVQAEALMALERGRAAGLAYARAHSSVRDRHGELARNILRSWGDLELAQGRSEAAAKRYIDALQGDDIPQAEADALRLSVAVALASVDAARASRWRSRIERPGAVTVRRRERELDALGRPAPTPAPTLARKGAIPSDPRTLVTDIQVRSQWGARSIHGDYDSMEAPWRLTVHHSARAVGGSSTGTVSTELRDIQQIHQGGKGWADVGYHFFIDAGGQVWEGRSLRYQGAHAGSPELNRGNVGVCLLGNFDHRLPPKAQLASLARLLDTLRRHFSIQAGKVHTHREIRPSPTACPGAVLQGWVDRYRASARTLARQ